jgi:hypothetical protein
MKLDKTLNNLRKTNKGFFNLENYFLNYDLLKYGLECSYTYNGVIKFYKIDKENLKSKTDASKHSFKLYNEIYIFKNILSYEDMILPYQLFVGNFGNLLKSLLKYRKY